MRRALLMALTFAALGGPVFAQSTGAPARRDPVTAPGGIEGLAGPRNDMDAVRDGDAVPVPPRSGRPDADKSTRPGEVPLSQSRY